MSTNTKPRAPRNAAAIKASADAAKVEAKAEATKVAQAAKVEAAEAAKVVTEASLSDRQAHYVNEYRNAETTHGSSKHAANVAAVAYYRTLPESVTVKTAKSSQVKPVSARERAAQTLEALCVKVERNEAGKVVKGLDTIGFTPVRVVQLVNAFTRAEVTGVVKVEALVSGEDTNNPEEVEALVSALDQAQFVGGVKVADALASSIRETIAEAAPGPEAGTVTLETKDGKAFDFVSPLALAVETAQSDVVAMREAKKEQAKETPVVKSPATVIADAVQVLWDAIEANSTDLDPGQKSALIAKMNALQEHSAKHLA